MGSNLWGQSKITTVHATGNVLEDFTLTPGITDPTNTVRSISDTGCLFQQFVNHGVESFHLFSGQISQ